MGSRQQPRAHLSLQKISSACFEKLAVWTLGGIFIIMQEVLYNINFQKRHFLFHTVQYYPFSRVKGQYGAA